MSVLSLLKTLLISSLLCLINSYKILVIYPTHSTSLHILGNALSKGLTDAGHEVTVISKIPFNYTSAKGTRIQQIQLEKSIGDNEDVNYFELGNTNPFMMLPFLVAYSNINNQIFLEHPKIQEFLHSKAKFDAVIVQQMFNEGMKALAAHFKAHLIIFETIAANTWINTHVGNPAPPSYIPSLLLNYNSDMSFWQRLENFFMYILEIIAEYTQIIPYHETLVKKCLPNSIDFNQALYNVSLILLNSHESTTQPVPLVPNMIQIGGFHIEPPQALPNDLHDFLDSAENGVIYFSLGSNVKPSSMRNETTRAFLNVLGSLKEKVLWKWDENLPDQPSNVKLGKWFPQTDILAHPNVKLFITHSGLLSMLESIFHGVPVLAVPVFGDQGLNAAAAEIAGYGLHMPFGKITEESLREALNKLLNDQRYRNEAKIRSQLMHDRPVKPMDLAIYWIEFVIKHKGAPHLRVHAIQLPWYKYLMLDIVTFLLVSVVLFTYIIYKIIYKIKSNKQRKKLKFN